MKEVYKEYQRVKAIYELLADKQNQVITVNGKYLEYFEGMLYGIQRASELAQMNISFNQYGTFTKGKNKE